MPDVYGGSDLSDVGVSLRGADVLVTGGTGFIGGRLVERLLIECGARPRVLLRDYGRAASLARFGLERIQLVKGGLSDAAALQQAVEGCKVVFHCAYDRGGPKANMAGMEALIGACLKNGARLVHVSTFATYEPLPDGDLTEDMKPVRSGIPYSEIKLDVEEAVKSRGLDAVIVMPTIVYGPYGKAWTLFPASQLKTGTVLLPESGEGLCNAVHVDDVCQGMIRAAVVPGAKGRRYFLSGSAPVTWGAYFQALADALGRPGPELLASAALDRKTTNPLSALKLLLGDPKRITRWGPVKGLAMWAKTRMTPAQKAKLKQVYGAYRTVAPAPVYTPAAQQMALFKAKCRVLIGRAETELGYRPAYDFARGAKATGEWLKWAMPSNE